jgi:cytochrome d ubiquinol oxidase subunit II
LWDTVFFLSSAGIALLLGVAFGNVMNGVPLDDQGNISVSLIALLNPFALLVGITTIAMLAMHGSIYLILKTEEELQARVRKLTPKLMVIFFVLNTLVVVAIVFFHSQITTRYLTEIWPIVFPALALAAMIVAWFMLRHGREFVAFVASGVMIALLLLAAAAGLYPNMLISTLDPAYNLTIFNGASASNSLTVMLIIALIGMPFVLLYTTGVYFIFRGKVQLTGESY